MRPPKDDNEATVPQRTMLANVMRTSLKHIQVTAGAAGSSSRPSTAKGVIDMDSAKMTKSSISAVSRSTRSVSTATTTTTGAAGMTISPSTSTFQPSSGGCSISPSTVSLQSIATNPAAIKHQEDPAPSFCRASSALTICALLASSFCFAAIVLAIAGAIGRLSSKVVGRELFFLIGSAASMTAAFLLLAQPIYSHTANPSAAHVTSTSSARVLLAIAFCFTSLGSLSSAVTQFEKASETDWDYSLLLVSAACMLVAVFITFMQLFAVSLPKMADRSEEVDRYVHNIWLNCLWDAPRTTNMQRGYAYIWTIGAVTAVVACVTLLILAAADMVSSAVVKGVCLSGFALTLLGSPATIKLVTWCYYSAVSVRAPPA